MREYETIFVTRANVSDALTNQLLERVNSVINRHGGTLLQQKNWGRKELAYKVGKETHGVYHYYNYCGDSGTVSDLERTLRLNDLPMKFLTVKLADKVDVNERKRQISKEQAEADVVATTKQSPVEKKEEEMTSAEAVEVKEEVKNA